MSIPVILVCFLNNKTMLWLGFMVKGLPVRERTQTGELSPLLKMTMEKTHPEKTVCLTIIATILFLTFAHFPITISKESGVNMAPPIASGPRMTRVTDTIYSSSSDGQLKEGPDANYNTAWTASSAALINTGGQTAIVGQAEDTDPAVTEYYIYRSFFYFDTAYIPDDAVIISATLSLHGMMKKTGSGAFDIHVQNGQPTYPHDPLENGDYDKSHYSGDGGSISTGDFSTSGYNDIPLTSTGISWIDKTGTTKLCVRNSEEIAGNPPNDDKRDWVSVCTSENEDYEPYLQVTYIANVPPDPPTHFFAIRQAHNKIYLGWRLDAEHPTIGYNVYRKAPGESGYFRIASDITDSTNYLDTNVTDGQSYSYYVRAVDDNGFESEDSNVETITAGAGTHLYHYIGNVVPSKEGAYGKIGDVNGDGLSDYLVICRGGDGVQGEDNVLVKIYLNGATTALFTLDTGECDGKLPLFPWTLWDMDGDGRDDLVGVLRHGSETDGEYYLHIIDPNTGNDNVPPVKVVNNRQSSKRNIHQKAISIAYLKGKSYGPFIVYKSGHYVGRNALDLQTFDRNLTEYWHWHVPKDNDWSDYLSACHQLEIADIDEDGKDEVFHGTYVFDDDGSYLWPDPCGWGGLNMNHVDGVHIGDIIPSNPGQEAYFYVEFGAKFGDSRGQGAYVVDKNGNILWEGSRKQHAHHGWIADITDDPGFEGMEVWCHFKGSEGMHHPTLYTSQGTEVDEWLHITQPIDWDGDGVKEVFNKSMLRRYHGSTNSFTTVWSGFQYASSYTFVYDVVGDYREEFVVLPRVGGGQQPMYVYTNTDVLSSRGPSPWEDLQYGEKKTRAGH